MGADRSRLDETSRKIRILFMNWADQGNVNAQNLNAREIALRLDPDRFESGMFFLKDPDDRLQDKSNIRLIRLPPRLGSLVTAAHMIWGKYDILFYPPYGRLMDWYRILSPVGRRKKIVATVEGTAGQFQAVPSPLKEKIMRVYLEADACYALSPHIAQTMREEFGLDLDVVPIGVDTSGFSPCDRTSRHRPINVLFVGSIQPRKQVHLLLDLAKQCDPKEAEFHIIGTILGAPDYWNELNTRKVEEKLDHVTFHGKQNQSEVARWMQKSDVFVLPSRLEGTPKVVLEASASGLPCILFSNYHTPSVVDGVTGFQVDTFEEMLAKLRCLIGDESLRHRMGDSAVRHIRQFDWHVVARQWENVFEKVSTQRKSL
jgi:glycosyltransferase involved in cell wall biosynthesis